MSMPVDRAPKAPSRATRAHRRRFALLLSTFLVLALPVFLSQANAALPLANPPTFNFVNDENGADDQPGQKDLSSQAVAVPAPGDLWVSWKWDVTSLSGGNTGDGCALFDTDADSKVNFAVCVTIQGNPAVQAPTSPRVYTCGDGKVDRCTSTYAQVSPINSACATNTNATDPFHSGQKDTQAICHIDLADVGGVTSANLVNTCSYPSQQPTSDPSDCVLIPRDAFLKITKVASPDTGSFPFHLAVTTDAFSTTPTFTAAGSQSSSFIAIRSDVAYKLKEEVPANWALTSASCTGASGSGSSNGALSGNTISGINASPDNQITCTFNDARQTGAIEITKKRDGTSTVLSGAHFTIDGAGDYVTDANGKVCVADLAIGSHTVTETQAPAGHDLPETVEQTVNVTGAGTCASGGGAATVTFNDPVVPGTINILKTDENDDPLEGAEFTLFNDNDPVGGSAPHGDEDTETTLTCTTGADGKCSIEDVQLGRYWVVETGVPAGYVAAADQNVTIGVGSSAGNGDVEELTFIDAPAAGRIDVHKEGFGEAPLEGAKFALYTDVDPLTPFGDPADEDTGKTCGPTDAGGDCSILDVAPGNYWLVEIVTPAGYDTADPEQVTVPLGSSGGQGAEVDITITDPVVPGTIDIHKTGVDGDLADAEFTLYEDNAAVGTFDGNDVELDTCTTDADGECGFTGLDPGNYVVRETVTPAGYYTVADEFVVIGIGTEAHVGDSETLELEDLPVPGTVSITKTDDAADPNPLAGAEFTLYVDNEPVGGDAPHGAEDTATALKCETDADGTCDISDVPLGDYWVVETKTPAHYDTADDQAIAVGLGDAAGDGETVPVSFVDPRQHRVVVLVCHEGTDTLHSSDVTVDGETKPSLAAGSLSGAQQKALCDTGGASFGDISGHGDVTAAVDLAGH